MPLPPMSNKVIIIKAVKDIRLFDFSPYKLLKLCDFRPWQGWTKNIILLLNLRTKND